MILTIGKKDIQIKEPSTSEITKVIEKETLSEVIFLKWVDMNTLQYVSSGPCELGHKLISGVAKIKER